MAGFKDYVFNTSPLWLKGFLLGVYSKSRMGVKYGPVYRAEVAELRKNARLGARELARVEAARLADFLGSVYISNGWYRAMMDRHGVTVSSVKADPFGALSSFDILEKNFLKDNVLRIESEQIPTYGVSNTSGTTGSPMVVPYDQISHQKGFAYWRRFYDQMGLGENFKNARFSGRILLGKKRNPRSFWVHDWAEKRLFFSTYHMTESNLSAYVSKLNRYKPDLIDGYPSALAILARFINDTDQKLDFAARAVATTAETLFEDDRRAIERAFGCKVFNQYASSEGAPFITECASGRLHLNTDTGHFELHDIPGGGHDVKELVVTSYRNLKLPLIRYRIGDSVRVNKDDVGDCSCGSAFPTVAAVEGRVEDLLYSTERGAIGRLDPVYKGVVGVNRSQIVQYGTDSFRLLLIPGAGYGEHTLRTLEKNFRSRVGQEVNLEILLIEEIPLSANGKFRAVVNKVPPRG